MEWFKASIAHRFIVLILLFSMVITTILTLIQLRIDYNTGINNLESKFNLIEKAYLNSLSNAIWVIDQESIDIQASGISKLSDFQYLQIRDDKGKVLAQLGDFSEEAAIKRKFKISYLYNAQNVFVGSMELEFSLEPLYRQLIAKTVVIALTQAIKTLLVSLFIFYIFYRLVGRYLEKIAEYAEQLNSHNLDQELNLNLAADNKTEINIVQNALNSMRKSLLHYINQTHDSQNLLIHQAHHDELTGLANRTLLMDRLETAMAEAHRNQWRLALFYMDLDDFKLVNDSYGHAVGDEVLKFAVKQFSSVLRESDTIARLGGDEFVLLSFVSNDDISNTTVLANKLIHSLNKPYQKDNISIKVNTSVGISIYPDDCMDAEELLRNADSAMYQSKSLGRNHFNLYSPELTKQSEYMLKMERMIDDAMTQNQFEIFFQPQYELPAQKMIGAEALIRWNHPDEGFISPAEFIPIAERTGQIVAIDQWVLNDVAQKINESLGHQLDIPRIAVNFSGVEFNVKHVSQTVSAIIESHSCPYEKIEVEITERVLMKDTKQCVEQLEKLRNKGIQVSVDDFGTGYSSLSLLKDLPIDKLKIDQSFTANLVSDRDQQAITRTIITLAQSLGLQVIAEGVETQQQQDYLLQLGCQQSQGYFYAKPMPFSEFKQLLK